MSKPFSCAKSPSNQRCTSISPTPSCLCLCFKNTRQKNMEDYNLYDTNEHLGIMSQEENCTLRIPKNKKYSAENVNHPFQKSLSLHLLKYGQSCKLYESRLQCKNDCND